MIFIETTSCLVLAYNVNCVGNIINKIRSYDLEKRNNMKTFRYIMDKANISDETTKRIGNYIRESSKIKRNYNLVEEKEFLESLPNSFRADLLKDSHRNIWQDIIFFKNLSENMLKSLSVRIEKKLAHPEEIIYNAEEEVSLMILGKGGFGYAYRKGASHRNGRLVSKIDVPAN